MDTEFWRRKWRDNQLGWHKSAAHPMLVRHVSTLGLESGARVFVPLCGKTRDIGWLLEAGFRVAGAELVEDAVRQLFAELGVAPAVAGAGGLKRYSAECVDIFVGNIFDLDAGTLGPVDAVYDRAALVALPGDVRRSYARHLAELTARALQLLITFDYDQDRMEGPPFSVPDAEVRALYDAGYRIEPLETAEIEGGLKGHCPALEKLWRLTPDDAQ